MDENNSELLNLLNSKKDFKYDGNKITLMIKQPIEKAGEKKGVGVRRYKNNLAYIQEPIRPFYRFKPIFVMCDKGTSHKNLEIIVNALKEVLSSVNMKEILPVYNLSCWNKGNKPHQSIDWYIDKVFNPKRKDYDINRKGQCNLDVFWQDLRNDPMQNERPHYDVIVLSDFDLYNPCYNYNFMIGEGLEQGTILSIMRYKDDKKEVIKQAALHEFGHTFANLDHCGSVMDGKDAECTMKFPNKIPTDLKIQAEYRIKENILFCNEHQLKKYELKELFKKKHLTYFSEIEELKNELYLLNSTLLKILDSGKLALLETKIILE